MTGGGGGLSSVSNAATPSRDRRLPRPAPTPGQVFLAFLALGLTSFGGPVAHIGYFREAFVARRGWLDERE